MSEQDRIESLHQRAAENYLQGQFNEALESWRELLALDPQDDRAIEGIRLCELIVLQSSGRDPSDTIPQPEPSLSASPEPGGSDVDFDEIASILSEPEEPEAEPVDDPGWDFSAIQAAEPLTDGLDLADLPALEAEPAEAKEEEAFELPGLDLGAPEENDVQAQVADLLSQAATSYDAGDLEGAMLLLDRVFGIDPNNVSANALAEAFRADIEVRDEPQAGEGPTPDAVADDNVESLGLAAPAGTPEVDEGPMVEAPPELTSPLPVMADDALSALDDPDQGTEAGVAAAPSASARKGGSNGKRLLIGVAVVASLAAAAFLGFQLTGSDKSGSAAADPTQTASVLSVQETATPQVDPDPQAGMEADPGAVVAQPEPAESLTSVMARGRAAFDGGEFSKAVVAFNEALQIAPDDPNARSGLAKAAAAYQEQREFMAKLDAATESFVRGDYREALRAFYRLPGTEGVARFDRFKANGWYNLGVTALKSGLCNDAKSHLKEASALVSADAGIAAASEYAGSCARSRGNAPWYDQVQQLPMRRLED